MICSTSSLRGRGFPHSSHPSPSTPRPSWTCACTRRGLLNLERAVECSSLRFRAFLHPRISCLQSCWSRSSSSHSHCGNHCLAAGASGACGRVSLYNLLNFGVLGLRYCRECIVVSVGIVLFHLLSVRKTYCCRFLAVFLVNSSLTL